MQGRQSVKTRGHRGIQERLFLSIRLRELEEKDLALEQIGRMHRTMHLEFETKYSTRRSKKRSGLSNYILSIHCS